jgi:hypothetical protein
LTSEAAPAALPSLPRSQTTISARTGSLRQDNQDIEAFKARVREWEAQAIGQQNDFLQAYVQARKSLKGHSFKDFGIDSY